MANFHRSLSTKIPARNKSIAGTQRNANPYAKCPSHGQWNTTLPTNSSKPTVVPAIKPYNNERFEFLNRIAALLSRVFISSRRDCSSSILTIVRLQLQFYISRIFLETEAVLPNKFPFFSHLRTKVILTNKMFTLSAINRKCSKVSFEPVSERMEPIFGLMQFKRKLTDRMRCKNQLMLNVLFHESLWLLILEKRIDLIPRVAVVPPTSRFANDRFTNVLVRFLSISGQFLDVSLVYVSLTF